MNSEVLDSLTAQRPTLLRTRWLVHKDSQEDLDYSVVHLTAVWKATNEQDCSLAARAHQGIASPAYLPGPCSAYAEDLVDTFCNRYLCQLRTFEGNNTDTPS
jgi:glycine betaine catabolism A